MPYVLEKMTTTDKESVLLAASAEQRNLIKVRHFFEDRPDLAWAVDREAGNFLMVAPKADVRSTANKLYFGIEGRLVELHIDGIAKPVRVVGETDVATVDQFQEEIRQAFAVHGLSGMAQQPAFVPIFKATGG